MKKIHNFKPGQVITLFDASMDTNFRGVLILVQKQQYSLVLRKLAFLSLFISIFGFTTIFYPIGAAEYNLRTAQPSLALLSDKDETYVVSLPEIGIYEFKIIIPKINIESEVIPNVDASNEDLYKSELMKGVAHAKGSYLPGQTGPMFLFSHSTDGPWNVTQYNAQFYALKELNPNDEILIFFNGKKYRYIIYEKRIINPLDITTIRVSNADLILSTCWPPGTSWQRLVVFAKQS